MALVAENDQHAYQIAAGTEGRLKGHKFEELVSEELNALDLSTADYLVTLTSPNIYQGNPAAALFEHISRDKNKAISRIQSYWLGGLATARKGASIVNEEGEVVTGSKSDVLLDITYADGGKEKVGISVKSCKNNAQVALTTSSAFCDMLRANGIPVTPDAEIGLKMFCGDPGYSPADGFRPKDSSNIPSNRKARPERYYWEEMPTPVQEEWEYILNYYQDKITALILQKANAYKTDDYMPAYILHECKPHEDIQDCQVAIVSMDEFTRYSRLFDTFGIKEKKVQKGRYKGIDTAIHKYPHFGFIQFQPIGNAQNFSELQFNLKASYYKQFSKLMLKE